MRDKLLGIDSDDIDISVNNMTGKKFATILKSQLNADSGNVPESYVVKLNPAKSKHLETAAVKVDNVWIDFVHLGEKYTQARVAGYQLLHLQHQRKMSEDATSP